MHERFTVTLPLLLGLDAAQLPSPHSLSTSLLECALFLPAGQLLRAREGREGREGSARGVGSKYREVSEGWEGGKGREGREGSKEREGREGGKRREGWEGVGSLRVVGQQLVDNVVQVRVEKTSSGLERVASGAECIADCEFQVFPFRLTLSVKEQVLLVRFAKLSVDFRLSPLPKPKYVKNERLQNLSKQAGSEWGLLTMDQSHRVVLEGQITEFPAIGIWLNAQARSPVSLTQRLAEYCSLELPKKCRFLLEGRKYFYLAKCPAQGKTPELYLVEWTTPREAFSSVEYPLSDIARTEELVLRSDEYSHLEFTLRSDEKVPHKLQSIQCSPIIFQGDSPSLSPERDEPDSPRFRTTRHSPLELECASLRRLVGMQQEEISQLRRELLRVTSSIWEGVSNQGYPAARTARTSRGKKLTEKDLSLGAPSEPPSTSTSSTGMGEDWNAWERFQILDK